MATTTDTRLPHERYLELLRHDTALLARAAARDLAAPVPYCDGWSARDLVVHAGRVWGQKATVISDRWPPGADQPPNPELPGGSDDALAWYEKQRQRLLDAFAGASADERVWTWADEPTVRFWARRMAQEALVHRIDAEAAIGAVSACDSDLVLDGIDEVLGTFLTNAPWRTPPGGTGDVVRFVSAGHEWHSTLGYDAIGFARGPGPPPAATVGAEPLPLLLWVWGRAPDDTVRVEGDRAAVARLVTLLRQATQ